MLLLVDEACCGHLAVVDGEHDVMHLAVNALATVIIAESVMPSPPAVMLEAHRRRQQESSCSRCAVEFSVRELQLLLLRVDEAYCGHLAVADGEHDVVHLAVNALAALNMTASVAHTHDTR